MRAAAVILLALLLSGCMGPSAGVAVMRFPSLTASWTAPDQVHAVAQGSARGRDVGEMEVAAFLVAGACPGEHDVPTEWLDRNATAMPATGRFDLEYRLELRGSVKEGGPYALMVGAFRPEVVPTRGWCAELTAGNDTARYVHP